jgi:hypothetical protein
MRSISVKAVVPVHTLNPFIHADHYSKQSRPLYLELHLTNTEVATMSLPSLAGETYLEFIDGD